MDINHTKTVKAQYDKSERNNRHRNMECSQKRPNKASGKSIAEATQ
jgi:hypothetical protein